MRSITIFFAVDDNYVHLLKVALDSLIRNASKEYKYRIIILNSELSFESKKYIRKNCKAKHFNISFFDVSGQMETLAQKVNVRDYYTMTTYFRLILPKTFIDVKKAIYLDADIVVRGDISEMFNYDLGTNLVGAVPDRSVAEFPEFAEYTESALEIKKENYFNAGILLMNLERMRKEKFEERIIDLTKKVSFCVAQDQDLLNVICKDRVLILPYEWNVMPLGEKVADPKIIHYNLLFKPWKQDLVMYEDIFWSEAGKAGVAETLLEYKNSITDEMKEINAHALENVKALCLRERERHEYYREGIADTKSKTERAEILEKIKKFELEGRFSEDVENDPPYIPLRPGDVDYMRRKVRSKFNAFVANKYSFSYFKRKVRKGEIVIDGYEGLEKLKDLKTGAVITANHFNPFDSIPLHIAAKKMCRKRKLFKVIREGNYTFPGIYGYFMRNCNTLPLASNIYLMKEMVSATEKLLKKGNLVLVYPEQSMWWNYRKPKPLKNGAFRFATDAGVPVLPTFITMRDTDKTDPDGYPIQAYTLHILDPIYPDKTVASGKAVQLMKEENERVWKELYENTYGKELRYDGE